MAAIVANELNKDGHLSLHRIKSIVNMSCVIAIELDKNIIDDVDIDDDLSEAEIAVDKAHG